MRKLTSSEGSRENKNWAVATCRQLLVKNEYAKNDYSAMLQFRIASVSDVNTTTTSDNMEISLGS